MCGRFSLSAKPEDLSEAMPEFQAACELEPRYNIAPTQAVATVLNDGTQRIVQTRWGLIPSWARDPEMAHRLINARAETLAEKPAFKASFRRRRCLILADGFFEWQKLPGQKTKRPFYFRMQSGTPFAFAGLWDEWNDREGGVLVTSTIITTEPNELVRPIHNRMPVILPREAYTDWLNPKEREPQDLHARLAPYPAEQMDMYTVSSRVNNPADDDPECVQPLRPR
ncbi:MAG: SOS response-associated peptidase [Kiritimatiellae bacterium]|nr:SOS response-associated peptidase [Kiritimatiellia bacterium]